MEQCFIREIRHSLLRLTDPMAEKTLLITPLPCTCGRARLLRIRNSNLANTPVNYFKLWMNGQEVSIKSPTPLHIVYILPAYNRCSGLVPSIYRRSNSIRPETPGWYLTMGAGEGGVSGKALGMQQIYTEDEEKGTTKSLIRPSFPGETLPEIAFAKDYDRYRPAQSTPGGLRTALRCLLP